MLRRLVLGHSPIATAIVDRLASQPGELYVVTADRGRITALREANVPAVEGDPTDWTNYPSAIDVAIAAASDPATTLAAAKACRSRFPDALLVAAVGPTTSTTQREALESAADELLDLSAMLSKHVLDAISGSGGRTVSTLRSSLRRIEGPLAVITHDNPDPDAIASALGFARLANTAGVEAGAYYFGDISHQENRALVNLLEIPIERLDPETFDPDEYGAIALVDHSRPGVNDGLPTETPVQFVIDHHPPRVPIDRVDRFVDIRPSAGSTCTLIAEYYRRLGVDPDEQVATALVFGIRTDTNDFTREVSAADYEATAFLYPYADESVLELVEQPSVGSEVLRTIAAAIRNREIRANAMATGVGEIRDRDTLAQAADLLLNMEGIRTVIVYGYREGVIYISGRARGSTLDLGETLREAFGQIGSAGGHAGMAGGQLSLGILEDVEEDSKDTLETIVRDIVAGRFFETLDTAPSVPTPSTDRPVDFPED
ncbi:MAG: DHH family phosphoesterase [Halobacteriota archaeon]